MPFAKSPAGLGGSAFAVPCACAIGGNGVTCAADACLQVRLQSGLTNYMMLGVFGGLCALLRDGCKSGFGMHEGIQSDA
jgi:hypothetical protein